MAGFVQKIWNLKHCRTNVVLLIALRILFVQFLAGHVGGAFEVSS